MWILIHNWLTFRFLGFFVGFTYLYQEEESVVLFFFFPSPVLYVSSEFATVTNSLFQKRQVYKFYEMIWAECGLGHGLPVS